MTIKRIVKNTLYGLGCFGNLRTLRMRRMSRLGTLPVAVVLYHRVDDDIFGESEGLTVTRHTFERHLKMYRDHYNVISVGELHDMLQRNETPHDWTVVITFDDGYRDNYLHAAPLLKKYGLPACFFLAAGYMDTDRQFEWDVADGVPTIMMSWEEARTLVREGFEMGAHTVNHINLGTAALADTRQEVSLSREILERQLDREVPYFSYPFGGRHNYSQQARQAVVDTGYSCAFTAFGGHVLPGMDLLSLPRIPISPYFRDESSIMQELECFFSISSYLRQRQPVRGDEQE